MRRFLVVTEFHRTDPVFPGRLAAVEKICLAIAVFISFESLLSDLFPRIAQLAPAVWTHMTAISAAAGLACAASMALQLPQASRRGVLFSRLFAIAGALPALANILGSARISSITPNAATADNWIATHIGHTQLLTAIAFALLAVVLLLLPARKGPAVYAADAALFGMLWLVLIILSGRIFGELRIFEVSVGNHVPLSTVCALPLLAFVAFRRRAGAGFTDVFLGSGIGSRMARGLTPILLILPFLREASRLGMIRSHLFPEQYAAAILASASAVLSVGLLILISRHVRRMEVEIRDLTLRDELTGIHNLRGFRLMAEHALRMAQRSQVAFSVLFVDVDELKQNNDVFGHSAGSALLVDTARLLQSIFRETDVIGRVGGDEFAVAGQFSRDAIEKAAERLETHAATLRENSRLPVRLSLSVGYVTSDPEKHEKLADLLEQADSAMYEQKRRKKLLAV